MEHAYYWVTTFIQLIIMINLNRIYKKLKKKQKTFKQQTKWKKNLCHTKKHQL